MVLLTICMMISSCVTTPHGPVVGELPQPEQVVARLELRRQAQRSFFMQGAISVAMPDGAELYGDHVIWGAYPDRIRADVYGPFGQPVLRLVADGNRLSVLAFDENRIYIGRATRKNIGAFLGVALSADEVYALLGGNAPMLENMLINSMSGEDQGNALLVVSDSASKVMERIRFRIADYSVVKAQMIQQGDKTESYTCTYSDFETLGPWTFPKNIETLGSDGRALSLKNDSIEFNKDFDGDVFETEMIEGVEIFWLQE